MVDTPGATMGQAAFVMGLPFGTPPPGQPQPTGLTKTALSVAPTVASKVTGIPGIFFTQVVRNFINPLLAKAFPNLFSIPNMTEQEAMNILGMPDPDPSVSNALEMGMVGVGGDSGTPGPSPEGFGPEGTSEGVGAPGTGVGGSGTGGAPW
jgi:hypothetical protein